MVKRYVADFLCAFVIAVVLFVCLGLLTNEGFLGDAFVWDENNYTLGVFGSQLGFDRRIFAVLERLLEFNDVVFGKGFSSAINGCTEFVVDYVKTLFAFLVTVGRKLVGAI